MRAQPSSLPEPVSIHPAWSIALQRVSFAYGDQARLVDQLDLAVSQGCRLAVLGPSGSGKTTLLRLLAGLLAPTTGVRQVGGRAPRIGLLPQDDPALPWRTVWRNMLLLKDGQLREADLARILTSVGLSPERYADRLPSALSGGERRRLGLAMVLASRPQLMLLDEASSSLDETTRFAIVDEILDTVQGLSAGLLAITHDVEEALLLGDLLLIFRGGGRVEHRAVDLPAGRRSELRFTPQFQALRADVVASLRR